MSQDKPEQVSAEVSPATQLMQMIFGFVTTQAISVAARLSLADLLKDGAKNAEELAYPHPLCQQPFHSNGINR